MKRFKTYFADLASRICLSIERGSKNERMQRHKHGFRGSGFRYKMGGGVTYWDRDIHRKHSFGDRERMEGVFFTHNILSCLWDSRWIISLGEDGDLKFYLLVYNLLILLSEVTTEIGQWATLRGLCEAQGCYNQGQKGPEFYASTLPFLRLGGCNAPTPSTRGTRPSAPSKNTHADLLLEENTCNLSL